MHWIKRTALFIGLNLLVILMVSLLLNIFNVQPYLSQHGINYTHLLIFCLIWGMAGAFISLALSRKMAKWMMGVKLIDPNTLDASLKRVLSTVEKQAQASHLPMPQVGIYESPEVNAFATGPTKKRSLIAVSRGLIDQMGDRELEAVLGHEMTHIANGDMVTMALLQGVVNAFVMFLARAIALVLSGMGKGGRQRGSAMTYIATVWVLEIVFMLLGAMLICWFSRRREFRADQGGAELAGKESMIAALRALGSLAGRRDQKMEKAAFQSLKISNTAKKGLGWLFASHPPIEERIARLELLRGS